MQDEDTQPEPEAIEINETTVTDAEPTEAKVPAMGRAPRCTDSVLVTSPEWGEAQPGIITKVWDPEAGVVNVTVFPDYAAQSVTGDGPPVIRKTSVQHHSQNGTFYWEYPHGA